MHSPHSNVSIGLNQLWKQLKVWNLIYIASTQMSQTALFKSHIINQVGMRLWIYSIWGKISLYLRTWKTGKKVISFPRTMMGQSYDSKHRHPIQKGRTQKNKKESAIPRNFKILSGNINKNWSPRIILCGSQLHIFGPKLHPGSQPSFFIKVTCAASPVMVFSACFLTTEPGIHSLPSINLLSVPFSPSWHCCCWCKILKWISYIWHRDPFHTRGSFTSFP